MSLMRQLKAYLIEVKQANILDLSRQLKVDALIVRDMLQVFIRKGYVCQFASPSKCAQCQKCDPLRLEMYQWSPRT